MPQLRSLPRNVLSELALPIAIALLIGGSLVLFLGAFGA